MVTARPARPCCNASPPRAPPAADYSEGSDFGSGTLSSCMATAIHSRAICKSRSRSRCVCAERARLSHSRAYSKYSLSGSMTGAATFMFVQRQRSARGIA